jgi:hypothetical protein
MTFVFLQLEVIFFENQQTKVIIECFWLVIFVVSYRLTIITDDWYKCHGKQSNIYLI